MKGVTITYGKAAVPVYRAYGTPLTGLQTVPESTFSGRENTLMAVEVDVEVFGDNFLRAYTEGDNSNVVATDTMKNSLMYKMSYYNYNSLFPAGQAQDRVRGSKLPAEGPELSTVEEAFTSENWIIRIYKVKKPDNLGRTLQEATSFGKGNKRKKTSGKRRGARVLRVE